MSHKIFCEVVTWLEVKEQGRKLKGEDMQRVKG